VPKSRSLLKQTEAGPPPLTSRSVDVDLLRPVYCVTSGARSASAGPLVAPFGDNMLFANAENMFTTEVWLTPLILLPGVALLIVSTSARFEQLHAEFHRLLEHPNTHAQILSRSLVRRSKLFRDALASLYVSVGVFSLGSLVGAFVHFFWPTSLWFVGGFTVIGIGCLVFAAIQLVRESIICLDVIREHNEMIREENEIQ
jgi:hypothetical protein